MPTEEKKWLKFHDGQYQFKVPFMLYAGFESILKPVDERYRDKMNRMKVGRKVKASYTENINTHVQQPMTGLTDVLKREHEAAEKCHICLKEFND